MEEEDQIMLQVYVQRERNETQQTLFQKGLGEMAIQWKV
jgi:hypothetical protein